MMVILAQFVVIVLVCLLPCTGASAPLASAKDVGRTRLVLIEDESAEFGVDGQPRAKKSSYKPPSFGLYRYVGSLNHTDIAGTIRSRRANWAEIPPLLRLDLTELVDLDDGSKAFKLLEDLSLHPTSILHGLLIILQWDWRMVLLLWHGNVDLSHLARRQRMLDNLSKQFVRFANWGRRSVSPLLFEYFCSQPKEADDGVIPLEEGRPGSASQLMILLDGAVQESPDEFIYYDTAHHLLCLLLCTTLHAESIGDERNHSQQAFILDHLLVAMQSAHMPKSFTHTIVHLLKCLVECAHDRAPPHLSSFFILFSLLGNCLTPQSMELFIQMTPRTVDYLFKAYNRMPSLFWRNLLLYTLWAPSLQELSDYDHFTGDLAHILLSQNGDLVAKNVETQQLILELITLIGRDWSQKAADGPALSQKDSASPGLPLNAVDGSLMAFHSRVDLGLLYTNSFSWIHLLNYVYDTSFNFERHGKPTSIQQLFMEQTQAPIVLNFRAALSLAHEFLKYNECRDDGENVGAFTDASQAYTLHGLMPPIFDVLPKVTTGLSPLLLSPEEAYALVRKLHCDRILPEQLEDQAKAAILLRLICRKMDGSLSTSNSKVGIVKQLCWLFVSVVSVVLRAADFGRHFQHISQTSLDISSEYNMYSFLAVLRKQPQLLFQPPAQMDIINGMLDAELRTLGDTAQWILLRDWYMVVLLTNRHLYDHFKSKTWPILTSKRTQRALRINGQIGTFFPELYPSSSRIIFLKVTDEPALFQSDQLLHVLWRTVRGYAQLKSKGPEPIYYDIDAEHDHNLVFMPRIKTVKAAQLAKDCRFMDLALAFNHMTYIRCSPGTHLDKFFHPMAWSLLGSWARLAPFYSQALHHHPLPDAINVGDEVVVVEAALGPKAVWGRGAPCQPQPRLAIAIYRVVMARVNFWRYGAWLLVKVPSRAFLPVHPRVLKACSPEDRERILQVSQLIRQFVMRQLRQAFQDVDFEADPMPFIRAMAWEDLPHNITAEQRFQLFALIDEYAGQDVSKLNQQVEQLFPKPRRRPMPWEACGSRGNDKKKETVKKTDESSTERAVAALASSALPVVSLNQDAVPKETKSKRRHQPLISSSDNASASSMLAIQVTPSQDGEPSKATVLPSKDELLGQRLTALQREFGFDEHGVAVSFRTPQRLTTVIREAIGSGDGLDFCVSSEVLSMLRRLTSQSQLSIETLWRPIAERTPSPSNVSALLDSLPEMTRRRLLSLIVYSRSNFLDLLTLPSLPIPIKHNKSASDNSLIRNGTVHVDISNQADALGRIEKHIRNLLLGAQPPKNNVKKLSQAEVKAKEIRQKLDDGKRQRQLLKATTTHKQPTKDKNRTTILQSQEPTSVAPRSSASTSKSSTTLLSVPSSSKAPSLTPSKSTPSHSLPSSLSVLSSLSTSLSLPSHSLPSSPPMSSSPTPTSLSASFHSSPPEYASSDHRACLPHGAQPSRRNSPINSDLLISEQRTIPPIQSDRLWARATPDAYGIWTLPQWPYLIPMSDPSAFLQPLPLSDTAACLRQHIVINATNANLLSQLAILGGNYRHLAFDGEFTGIFSPLIVDASVSKLERARQAVLYNDVYQLGLAFFDTDPNSSVLYVTIECSPNNPLHLTSYPHLHGLFDDNVPTGISNDDGGQEMGPMAWGYLRRRLNVQHPFLVDLLRQFLHSKTLIVHNGLHDVLHLLKLLDPTVLYRPFSPEDDKEDDAYLSALLKIVNRIFDTKVIASHAQNSRSSEGTSLKELATTRCGFPGDASFHTAGVDALATAKLFSVLSLSVGGDEGLSAYANRMYNV